MVLAFDNSGNLTDRYLWGPAVDQVLADENFVAGSSGENENGGLPKTAGVTLWALGDNQNTVRDVVTDSGALEQHIAYSPFGQQVTVPSTVSPSVADLVFGYTGTYTDPVTGLQLHGVRWYDPSVGRWLTEDPAAADANLYRYCGNAPTNGTDPDGLQDCDDQPDDYKRGVLTFGLEKAKADTGVKDMKPPYYAKTTFELTEPECKPEPESLKQWGRYRKNGSKGPKPKDRWVLTPGSLTVKDVKVVPYVWYKIAKADGSRVWVKCSMTDKQKNFSKAHEQAHIENAKTIIDRYNKRYCKTYDSLNDCEEACDAWIKEVNLARVADYLHVGTDPKSPKPTDPDSAYAESKNAGKSGPEQVNEPKDSDLPPGFPPTLPGLPHMGK
jgi:RHS repeat-associated protein